LVPAVVPAFSPRALPRSAAVVAATWHMRAPPTFIPQTSARLPALPGPE
jgi:hypothetical protein